MNSQRQFEEIPIPLPDRRPSFPKKLLEKDKFIDPIRESELIRPQLEASASPLIIDAKLASQYKTTVKTKGAIASAIEYILSIFEGLKARMKKSGKRRVRLTKKGQQTLEQLRYLSLLCDATAHRSEEEVLQAEGAFGEAYYEIMQLSGELSRMSESEQAHHLNRYASHMGKLLRFD